MRRLGADCPFQDTAIANSATGLQSRLRKRHILSVDSVTILFANGSGNKEGKVVADFPDARSIY
jgi:hypothetical protein